MKTRTALPSKTYLNECFIYNKRTGILKWKTRPRKHFLTSTAMKRWNSRFQGMHVGWMNKDGYLMAGLDGKEFLVHRLIWKIMTGRNPSDIMDHKNGQRRDNKFKNLRLADEFKNGWNCKRHTDNRSGVKGVYLRKDGKYVAEIMAHGKRIYLGIFTDISTATQARVEAANKIHSAFVNHGT